MLVLTLTSNAGPIGSLELANEGGQVYCDYAAVLYDWADRPVSMALVERYARWSAPACDLLLRALALALCDSEVSPAWERVRYARPSPSTLLATLALQPPFTPARHLAHWHVDLGGRVTEQIEGEPGSTLLLPTLDASASAWAVMARVWCHRLSGSLAMPPRHPPVSVPLHWHGTASYVRLGECPEHVRVVLEQRLRFATRPLVVGVPDAVYSWDVASFLGYTPWSSTGSMDKETG